MRNLFSLARPAWGGTPALARPLAALGLLLATAGAAQAQTTTNFTFTAPGSAQSYTVPAGITKLNVVATGGGGGGNRGNNKGGLGAVVQATVTVVPGEVLTVVVGGRGVDSNNNGTSSVGGAGGYNGGGNGSYTGGGGGGATDLRRAVASGSTGDYFTSRNALLVAGGGGGGDTFGNSGGGSGGTPTGGNGGSGQGGPAGQGATTTALGGGYLGSNGTGGNGNPNNFNAAGGGGYYGGGGGGGAAGSFTTGVNGGGGGSSYVLPTGSSNVSYSLAGALANGALAITTVPTPTNNALAFDGSNDVVTIPNNAAYTITSAITLETWLRTSVAGERYITTKGEDSWYLAINGGGGPTGAASFFVNGPSGPGGWLYGTSNLADGKWHHVAGTYDGATLRLYVDGVQQNSRAATGAIQTGTSPVSLGARNNGNFWNGSLDEFRLYNTALTAAQVQADMFSANGAAAVPASQVAYYNFDQGTAGGNNAGITSLTDQSSNGNTGTLNNFALTGTSSNWVRSFPTITGIAPTSGNIGSSVTLTGTNLTDATSFAFNGTAVSPFTTPTADLMATVTVPSGATTGPVSVSSATLTTYNGPTFTVTYADLVVTTTTTVPAGIYNSITVNSPGVATLGGNVTVNTSTTVNSGATLNDGCFVLSGAGSFTLAAGGTLGICNANGIAASGATGAIQNTGTRSFASDASYVYNGTAAQVTGAGLPSQVRNLTSTNSNTVTLSGALAIRQVLTLNAGSLDQNSQSLTLLSDASGTALIANLGNGQVQGATTVQRYIDPTLNAGLGYRHLSAPVFDATVASFSLGGTPPVINSAYNSATNPGTVTPFPTIFSYDQSRLATSPATTLSTFDKGWVSPTSLSDGAELAFTGFTVQLPGASTLSFLGQVVGGSGSIPLSRASGATAADAGLNFIGNPYPSPLDFSTITAGQRTNMDAAFYVFESTSQYGGAYRSYVNGVASTGGTSLIGTAQGFFVRVTAGQSNGQLALGNANRITTYGQQSAVRRTAAETRPLVRLALQGASGSADGFVAYAQAGATAGFDGEYDAAKLPNSTGLNLSSATATGSLSIDGRAAFTAATVLALNVGVPAAGTYTLAAAELLNLPAGLTATLRDAATGQLTPLAAGTSYSFAVTATEATALLTGRFTLQFSSTTPLATAAASLLATEVTVYPNPAQGRFTVLVPAVASASQVQAELLNTLGQVVSRQSASLPAAGATLSVDAAGLATGVYTLRLTAGASTLAKRVVLQ